MKTKGIKALANKITVIGCCLLVIGLNACTDDIKFGSSFLEKAPSSDVT